jgi:hypothetical protein
VLDAERNASPAPGRRSPGGTSRNGKEDGSGTEDATSCGFVPKKFTYPKKFPDSSRHVWHATTDLANPPRLSSHSLSIFSLSRPRRDTCAIGVALDLALSTLDELSNAATEARHIVNDEADDDEDDGGNDATPPRTAVNTTMLDGKPFRARIVV